MAGRVNRARHRLVNATGSATRVPGAIAGLCRSPSGWLKPRWTGFHHGARKVGVRAYILGLRLLRADVMIARA